MNTDILYSATMQRNTVASGDDSAVEVITVTMDLPYHPTISDIKEAIRAMAYEIESIEIGRPRSEYDCTGKAFTTSLETAKRFIARGCEKHIFVCVVVHHVAFDV